METTREERKQYKDSIGIAREDGYSRNEFLLRLIRDADRLERAERDLSKAQKENKIRKRAAERWTPCPDHRDKRADDRCIVCRAEQAERERDEARRLLKRARPIVTWMLDTDPDAVGVVNDIDEHLRDTGD